MSEPESTPAKPVVQAATPVNSEPYTRPLRYWRRRLRVGLVVTVLGLLVFLIGARPVLFGFDRSPIIGFVQIAVFLVGLALICIGGYVTLTSLWANQETSIAADIGQRLVATGYVIAVFAAMADIFGFGSHSLPKLPFFGPLQARGVELGQFLIAVGFLMLIPYSRREKRARKLGS